MKVTRSAIVLTVCIAALSFVAGSWWNRGTGSQRAATGGRKILYYHDPMHPAYKSDKPGIAPDCGMQLEPVYADENGQPDTSSEDAALPPGIVKITAEKQQLIGVRSEAVQKGDVEYRFRILGRVAADETRTYRLNAPADGLIRELGTVTTGSIVQKDETLGSFVTRDSLTLRDQQAYLVRPDPRAVSMPTAIPQQTTLTLELARDLLRLGGMPEDQLAEIARTHQAATKFKIVSPVKGYVLARNAAAGELFQAGREFYRIADLDSVWVLGDVFENEARLIDSSTTATVRYQGRTFPARRSAIPPQFDPSTRALKVRYDVANPDWTLRPDMFADIDFTVKAHAVITVPVDAVIDSGMRKTVFVDRGDGYFEPRAVETGPRLGDRIVIAEGLEPGERIVVSGNFLIDSESRFQLAAKGLAGPLPEGKDPVCGMDVDPAKTKFKSEYQGKTYHFCSDSCKKKFDARPTDYISSRGPA